MALPHAVTPADAFAVDFRIEISDLSPSHHVNNVSFLRYLDEARALFFGTAIGSTRYRGGILEVLGASAIAVVGRNEVEYRAEVGHEGGGSRATRDGRGA